MADLRIVDAPLLSTVKGTEKLPTGGEGNFSVSVNQVADFAKLKWFLATESYVDNAVGNVQSNLDLHKNDLSNPHQVSKVQVGLGNVDNTADLDKPVSNATQSAITTANSGKADKSYVDSQDQLKADKNTVEASLLLKADKVDLKASKILSDGNQTQQSVNDFGGARWYEKSGGYELGATVKLANGSTVKNTVANNVIDPNVDMSGWILVNSDSQIKTWSGRTQEERNKDQVNLSDYKKLTNTHTQALQDAINANPKRCIHVSSGVYEINSVSIPHSISFMCEQGVVFKRGNNLDIRQSPWNDGTAMFEAKAQGIAILFFGGMTFDGNNQNQLNRFQEPTGFSVKIQPPVSPVVSELPVYLYMQKPTFINGTSGYLCVRGDDVNRRYLTKVVLDNPEFHDTIMGTGKGDPLALNPLGYQPDYCTVYDYVHFITNNLTMQYSKATGMGEYAPVGIRGTFFGTDYATSGECSIFLNGLTTLKNMGRSGKLYNNNSDYLTNNGIGVIDVYGNGETLYVENVEATDSQNVTIRAKASVKNFTVKTAVLKNCHRGLQVSASTTGLGEAIVNIGSLTSVGGTIPQLEITGTSATDRVKSATVGACNFYGTYTNPESLAASSHGNFHVRNVEQFISLASDIESSPLCAMRVQDIDVANIYSLTAISNNPALLTLGVKKLNIYAPNLTSTGGAGISIQASASTPTKVNVSGGSIESSVDNGILNAANNAVITVDSLAVEAVSGLSRAFSNTVGSTMKLSKCSTNATTPAVKNGSQIFEIANSWNPNIQYGTVYLTTIGTAKAGDIVYNTAPAAAGTIGWVCTVAGSPGTWKAFGNIAT